MLLFPQHDLDAGRFQCRPDDLSTVGKLEFDPSMKVLPVSAHSKVDERTGAAFYRADIAVDKADIAGQAGLELVPGMPAEAFVRTGERNVLSWLLKPITDHAARAMREE